MATDIENPIGESALVTTERLLELALHSANICIYVVDIVSQRYVLFKNSEAIFGLTENELLSDLEAFVSLPPEEYKRSVSEYFSHPGDAATIDAAFRSIFEGYPCAYYARMRARGSRYKWCKLNVTPVFENGVPAKMVGVISDVNDLKKQAEEWKQRSRIDLFSGLLNKETVLESISARIGKKGARFALLLIDFDGFKEINDTYGHLVGDDVIREFSRILRAAFPDDLVGRFGGDEFILLTEMQTLRDASRAVSAVLGICVRLPGLPEMRLSQSVGAVLFEGGGSDLTRLLGLADKALYRSKQRKKGSCTVMDGGENSPGREIELPPLESE